MRLFGIAFLVVMGLLFGAAAVAGLVSRDGIFLLTFAIGCVAASMLYGAYCTAFEPDRQKEFLAWLAKNRQQVTAHSSMFHDAPVTTRTVVTKYHMAIAMGLVHLKTTSRYYIVGHHPTALIAIAYSFVSIILGWWSLPFGPLETVRALRTNIRGGDRKVVADLLREIPDKVQPGNATGGSGTRSRKVCPHLPTEIHRRDAESAAGVVFAAFATLVFTLTRDRWYEKQNLQDAATIARQSTQ